MRIRQGKIIVIIRGNQTPIPIDKNWRSAKAILARGGIMRDKASEC